MEEKELVKQIEAILFAAARAVSKDELKLFCAATDEEIEHAAKELAQKLDNTDSAMMLLPESAGWKLAVREKFTSPLRNIVPNTELNRSVLETLAVIAWKQPVMQADVIGIRTTKAYEHISELEELGFIARQKHGRSFILKTSKKFNEYFDLPKQEAIKELFKDIKDESGKSDNPQKKIGEHEIDQSDKLDLPKVELYDLKNREDEFADDKLGRLDLYETAKEKEKLQEDDSPKEEFYEKTEEDDKDVQNKDESGKKEVYIELGDEDDASGSEDGEESLTPQADEENTSDSAEEATSSNQPGKEKKEKSEKKDDSRKLDSELEDLISEKEKSADEAKKEEDEYEE